jgi:error-prone DNA polymerase
VLGLDVNSSQVQCKVEKLDSGGGQSASCDQAPGSKDAATGGLGVRIGLGYVKGAIANEVRELVAERERGGPFADLGDLAARAATRRGTLEQLAWGRVRATV